MNVFIMGGFLGSGKTSIILQMAEYLVSLHYTDSDIFILENEIGTVGIDDSLLSRTGLQMRTLFSGCICCSLAGELQETVRKIYQEFHPQWLILETTGMAIPSKIKEGLLKTIPDIHCQICCVTDMGRWKKMQRVKELQTFLREQLMDADIILMNKCDLIDQLHLSEIEENIQSIRPSAKIFHITAVQPISDSVWKSIFREDLNQSCVAVSYDTSVKKS